MSHLSPFSSSKNLLKREKMDEFQFHFLLLLFLSLPPKYFNVWNGHRLNVWTIDFLFHYFSGLFFCTKQLESFYGLQKTCLFEAICPTLLLQISSWLPWELLSVVMVSMGWMKFRNSFSWNETWRSRQTNRKCWAIKLRQKPPPWNLREECAVQLSLWV